MLSYDKLVASGLPITWTVIRIGYRDQLLVREEVQAHAREHLGRNTGEIDYLAFRLFDADPTNSSEIVYLLEQLEASESGGDEARVGHLRNLAERIWNALILRDWLAPFPPSRDEDYDYLVLDIDRYLPFPKAYGDSAPPSTTDVADFDAALESLRQWAAEQEEILKREHTGDA